MAGQYIMRKFGRLGLLTGTQPFYPTQFHRFVSFFHCHCISSLWLLHRGGQWLFAVTDRCRLPWVETLSKTVLGRWSRDQRGKQYNWNLPWNQLWNQVNNPPIWSPNHLHLQGGQNLGGRSPLGHNRVHRRIQWQWIRLEMTPASKLWSAGMTSSSKIAPASYQFQKHQYNLKEWQQW